MAHQATPTAETIETQNQPNPTLCTFVLSFFSKYDRIWYKLKIIQWDVYLCNSWFEHLNKIQNQQTTPMHNISDQKHHHRTHPFFLTCYLRFILSGWYLVWSLQSWKVCKSLLQKRPTIEQESGNLVCTISRGSVVSSENGVHTRHRQTHNGVYRVWFLG